MHMPPSQLLAAALVSALLLLWRPAGAAEYTVGGDGINGWDTGTNYATWAQAQSFVAGDALLFNYVKSQHNVYEVTEAAYRSCDATAPGSVLATYDTGFDRIVLPDAKTYWFICEIPNHCIGGMKLAVNVSGAGAPGGSPTIDVPPPSPSAATRSSWTAAWGGLVVLGVVHVLVNLAA
ncbi:basic blue protein-like [Lolium rigidum]|uniref:basic blue protein-like n=1 Tax=Lolium rigidum TaxID=89674 RepID=UPI001F5D9A7B|nr:basic blue protein-like [Lolium rigidum]